MNDLHHGVLELFAEAARRFQKSKPMIRPRLSREERLQYARQAKRRRPLRPKRRRSRYVPVSMGLLAGSSVVPDPKFEVASCVVHRQICERCGAPIERREGCERWHHLGVRGRSMCLASKAA